MSSLVPNRNLLLQAEPQATKPTALAVTDASFEDQTWVEALFAAIPTFIPEKQKNALRKKIASASYASSGPLKNLPELLFRVWQRLRGDLDEEFGPLSEDQKTAIYSKLFEETDKCPDGVVDRVSEIILTFSKKVYSFNAVLKTIRQELVRQTAAQHTNEVHATNRFGVIARNMGYGVVPTNPEDRYVGSISDSKIEESLELAFNNYYFCIPNLIPRIVDQMKTLLMIYGYRDNQTASDSKGYSVVEIQRFYRLIGTILEFGEAPVRIEEKALLKPDVSDEEVGQFADIDWRYIQSLIFKRLTLKHEGSFYFSREEEEGALALFSTYEFLSFVYEGGIPEPAFINKVFVAVEHTSGRPFHYALVKALLSLFACQSLSPNSMESLMLFERLRSIISQQFSSYFGDYSPKIRSLFTEALVELQEKAGRELRDTSGISACSLSSYSARAQAFLNILRRGLDQKKDCFFDITFSDPALKKIDNFLQILLFLMKQDEKYISTEEKISLLKYFVQRDKIGSLFLFLVKESREALSLLTSFFISLLKDKKNGSLGCEILLQMLFEEARGQDCFKAAFFFLPGNLVTLFRLSKACLDSSELPVSAKKKLIAKLKENIKWLAARVGDLSRLVFSSDVRLEALIFGIDILLKEKDSDLVSDEEKLSLMQLISASGSETSRFIAFTRGFQKFLWDFLNLYFSLFEARGFEGVFFENFLDEFQAFVGYYCNTLLIPSIKTNAIIEIFNFIDKIIHHEGVDEGHIRTLCQLCIFPGAKSAGPTLLSSCNLSTGARAQIFKKLFLWVEDKNPRVQRIAREIFFDLFSTQGSGNIFELALFQDLHGPDRQAALLVLDQCLRILKGPDKEFAGKMAECLAQSFNYCAKRIFDCFNEHASSSPDHLQKLFECFVLLKERLPDASLTFLGDISVKECVENMKKILLAQSELTYSLRRGLWQALLSGMALSLAQEKMRGGEAEVLRILLEEVIALPSSQKFLFYVFQDFPDLVPSVLKLVLPYIELPGVRQRLLNIRIDDKSLVEWASSNSHPACLMGVIDVVFQANLQGPFREQDANRYNLIHVAARYSPSVLKDFLKKYISHPSVPEFAEKIFLMLGEVDVNGNTPAMLGAFDQPDSLLIILKKTSSFLEKSEDDARKSSTTHALFSMILKRNNRDQDLLLIANAHHPEVLQEVLELFKVLLSSSYLEDSEKSSLMGVLARYEHSLALLEENSDEKADRLRASALVFVRKMLPAKAAQEAEHLKSDAGPSSEPVGDQGAGVLFDGDAEEDGVEQEAASSVAEDVLPPKEVSSEDLGFLSANTGGRLTSPDREKVFSILITMRKRIASKGSFFSREERKYIPYVSAEEKAALMGILKKIFIPTIGSFSEAALRIAVIFYEQKDFLKQLDVRDFPKLLVFLKDRPILLREILLEFLMEANLEFSRDALVLRYEGKSILDFVETYDPEMFAFVARKIKGFDEKKPDPRALVVLNEYFFSHYVSSVGNNERFSFLEGEETSRTLLVLEMLLRSSAPADQKSVYLKRLLESKRAFCFLLGDRAQTGLFISLLAFMRDISAQEACPAYFQKLILQWISQKNTQGETLLTALAVYHPCLLYSRDLSTRANIVALLPDLFPLDMLQEHFFRWPPEIILEIIKAKIKHYQKSIPEEPTSSRSCRFFSSLCTYSAAEKRQAAQDLEESLESGEVLSRSRIYEESQLDILFLSVQIYLKTPHAERGPLLAATASSDAVALPSLTS